MKTMAVILGLVLLAGSCFAQAKPVLPKVHQQEKTQTKEKV